MFRASALHMPCSLVLSALVMTGLGALALGQSPTPATEIRPAGAAQPPDAHPVYNEKADAALDIEKALAKAKRENRRVLIQWGGNWCSWCRLLDGRFKSDPKLARKLSYEYDIVHVDIGKWDKHMDLAQKYGAQLRDNGVPFLTILDADGNVITNQETESFEKEIDGKPGHDPELLNEFLTKHQAPYLPAESILNDAIARAKKTERYVFVHFGAPWCGWCHRLEDWMHREPARTLLANDFVDVKIDIDRTIGGSEMLNRYRGSERGGIPWFVFLDAKGNVIATSDGPDGNVGCPYTDEEIAAFAEILKKARKTLTDEQIDKLVKTLGPKPAALDNDH